MSSTAVLIAILYGAVSVVAIAAAVIIWRSTHRTAPGDAHKLAEREKTWFGIAVGLLAVLLFATIFFTPDGKSAPAVHQTVKATAQQFAWTLQPGTVRAGVPVEFDLISKDVNHGFAVYAPDGTFVTQVQVVPDRVTKLIHTFTTPGTYEILCFEFCGLNHSGMIGSFRVTA